MKIKPRDNNAISEVAEGGKLSWAGFRRRNVTLFLILNQPVLLFYDETLANNETAGWRPHFNWINE